MENYNERVTQKEDESKGMERRMKGEDADVIRTNFDKCSIYHN